MSERLSFHEEIRNNKIKSVVLIIAIFILFLVLGAIIALAIDPSLFFVIMVMTIILSLIYIIPGYYNGHRIALASVKARAASPTEHRMLFNAVENMSIAAGLPMPKVYVMESEQINAFASGKDPKNSVICVTTGALQKLNKQELEGVIAHEMSHVANYDIRFMTLAAVLVGMIAIAAEIFLRNMWFSSHGGGKKDGKGQLVIILVAVIAAIIVPLIARLISLAISRKREYSADATGVKLTRYPIGLRNALIKIRHEHVPSDDMKRYPKSVAPLFISDPFKKKIKGLFSTHPPIETRIEILERM